MTVRTGCALVASSVIALGLLGASPAFADTASDDVLAAVAEATPETANNAASVVTTSMGEVAIDATISDVRIVVPTDPVRW
jgi:hypothetical protein